MAPSSTATISGQPGPQTEFLRTPADICIYGGAAGGGKTVGLILEPLRHVSRVTNFTAVFFRRTTPQITNPGGLWDESQNFYLRLGGTPHLGAREWRWPCAGKIKFAHLQFDTTVYDWQGAQITLICFDELTHFTAHQFFYMVSRDHSTATSSLTSVHVQPGLGQPNWTVGIKVGRDGNGGYWLLDIAPAGEPGRRRKTQHRLAGRRTGPHRVWPRPGAGR